MSARFTVAGLVGAALLCGIAPARGEVRLARSLGAWDVRVVPAQQGVWSPVAPASSATLNPTGDLVGDGRPAWARSEDSVLVGWLSPSSSSLLLALGEGTWRAQAAVPTVGAEGAPLVRRLDGAWLVVWDDGTSVRVLGVRAEAGDLEVAAPGITLEGDLVEAVTVGESLQVLTWDADLRRLGLVVLVYVPGQPIGPFVFSSVALAVLPGAESTGLAQPSHAGHVATGAHHPSPGRTAAPSDRLTAADLRVHDIQRDHERAVLVTWWSGARELSFVELAEDGPVLPVDTLSSERGPEHPQRLVQEAIRIVEDRR